MYSFKTANDLSSEETFGLYKKYSNKYLPDLYSKFSFGKEKFVEAKGCYLTSENGEKVFDFTGGLGVANMGHNHPRLIKVRNEFSAENRLEIHKSYLNRFLAAASYNLAAVLPNDLNYSFFCNSGAEAVDGALKLAYKYHHGHRGSVLRSERSFHGKTIGAGSLSSGDNFVSGAARFSFQKIPGVKTYNFNSIDSLVQVIEQSVDGVYAIFVEPFSCSTLTECTQDFLLAVRELCDQRDILLVFDEIYSGFAKCGPNFYMEKYGVTPDIVTLSKALGGGKSSISAYVARDHVFEKAYGSRAGALMHSTTYNSFGEECVTALEACNILVEEKLSEKSNLLQDVISTELTNLKKLHPSVIKEVRGAGTHFGLSFTSSLEMLSPLMRMVPVAFFQDPRFVQKLVVTSLIEEFYCESRCLCAFTANNEVFLNFSPAPIADPTTVASLIREFDSVLQKGLYGCVASFVKKNLTS